MNADDESVIGVLQAINKVAHHADVFSKDDVIAAQQYCSHLSRAVVNCQRKQTGKEELLQSSMEIKKFTVNVAASLAEMKIEESQGKKKPSSPLKGLARFRNAAKRVAEEEKKKNQEKKRTSMTSVTQQLRLQLREETEDYKEATKAIRMVKKALYSGVSNASC